MSHSRDLAPAGNVDPPSVPMANAQAVSGMDGHELVQWLTIQAGDVPGTLQQGTRALLTQANARPPEPRR